MEHLLKFLSHLLTSLNTRFAHFFMPLAIFLTNFFSFNFFKGWGAVAWSQLGKTPIRTNILVFGLCGSWYLSAQHCWRVGWGDGVEPWRLFTAGQDADQDQHSSLRPLWFILVICSALLESRVGWRWGAVVWSQLAPLPALSSSRLPCRRRAGQFSRWLLLVLINFAYLICITIYVGTKNSWIKNFLQKVVSKTEISLY